MITLNSTSFPLFLTFEEAPSYGHEVPLSDTLAFAAHLVVGAATLVPGVEPREIHEYCWLNERVNADAVRTTDGELRFEYSSEHLNIILELAAEHGIRAWDAVAFIVQQVFPRLTVLDSISGRSGPSRVSGSPVLLCNGERATARQLCWLWDTTVTYEQVYDASRRAVATF